MYNNVGLRTARGTGTSGYVERSLAAPRGPAYSSSSRAPYAADHDGESRGGRPLRAHTGPVGQSVLKHEARRAVELRCIELEDRLHAEGVSDGEEGEVGVRRRRPAGHREVERRVAFLRERLLRELATPEDVRTAALRAEKDARMARLRVALNIDEGAVEGAVFASFDWRGRAAPNAEGMLMPSYVAGAADSEDAHAESVPHGVDTLPDDRGPQADPQAQGVQPRAGHSSSAHGRTSTEARAQYPSDRPPPLPRPH